MLRRYTCLFFAAIMVVGTPASAELWSDHLKPSLSDGMDWKGFAILAAGGAAAAAFHSQDESWHASLKDHYELSESALKFGDFFGTGIPGALIALVQWQYDAPAAKAMTEALVYNFVSTEIIKTAADRERPNGGSRSMPSGHTSSVFATATALAYRYGWIWAIPGYAVAAFVGYERVVDDAHWPTDVLAGAALGIFWGRATHFHEFRMQPWYDGEEKGGGVAFRREF